MSESAATCPGCGRPVAECQAEDVDERFPVAAYDRRLLYVGTADEQKLVNSEALAALVAERDRLASALFECAAISGADVSDGVPTEPPLEKWAVQEVEQLRSDYDEAIGALWKLGKR